MKQGVVWTRGTCPDTGETNFIVQCGQGLIHDPMCIFSLWSKVQEVSSDIVNNA